MSRFQERWIIGKTIERVEALRRPDSDSGRSVYQECVLLVFTDGSSLSLLSSEDEFTCIVVPRYYPATKGTY